MEIVEYTNVDRQKWIISYTDGIYSLSPKSNDDVNIYIDSVENTGLLISLDPDYAPEVSYWGGTYGTHSIGEILNLVIDVDEDVIDSYFGSIDNSDELFFDAIDQWNNKCDNVCIFMSEETAPNDYYVIEIKLGSLRNGLYGETHGYLYNAEAGYNISWEKCVIYLDITQINAVQEANDIPEIIFKQQIITHEMGHALKLTHPFEESPEYLVLSIMNNYIDDNASKMTAEPTAYDVYFLNEKWG